MPQGLGVQLGLGGGRSATASGAPAGDAFVNEYSLHFDGTDDYLSIPHNSALTIAGDMSISAWVKRTELVNASAGGYVPILTKRSSTASDTNYQFYCDSLDGSAAGGLRFYDGNAARSPASATVIPAGAWRHVVITIDSGVTNGTKWYVNGSAETGTNTMTIDNSNTDPVMIGKLGAANYYTKGLTDDVALFDSILSASDVTAIYNSGVPASLKAYSPVGWWRMGEGATWDDTNWTIPDASEANSNAGTTANMVEGSRSTDFPS